MEEDRRRLYQLQADVMKALAHPLRLAIADEKSLVKGVAP